MIHEHTIVTPKPHRRPQQRTVARWAAWHPYGARRPSFFRSGVRRAAMASTNLPRWRPLVGVDLPQPNLPGHLMS